MKVAESLFPVKPKPYAPVKELPATSHLPKLTVIRGIEPRKENFHEWSMPKEQAGYIRVKKNDLF